MATTATEPIRIRGPVSLLRWLFDLLRQTYDLWSEERTIRLGAGLAYYGIFAVVPLLTLSVALAQVIFSQTQIQEYLVELFESIFGQQEATEIAAKVADVLDSGSTAASLGLIGIVSLIIAASLFFVALQDALNQIWDQPRARGFRGMIRRYGLAYVVVLLTGSLLVASLAIHSIAGLAEQLIPGQLVVLESLADLVAMLASWALGIAVLAVLFKVLPHTGVSWHAAIIGATVTAGAMAIGNWAAGYYIDRFATSSLAGAAGSVLLGLVWIYYITNILLAGAVLTRIITERSPGEESDTETTDGATADSGAQDKPASTNW